MLGMIVLFSIACTPPPPAVQTPALRTLAPEWNGDGRFNSRSHSPQFPAQLLGAPPETSEIPDPRLLTDEVCG